MPFLLRFHDIGAFAKIDGQQILLVLLFLVLGQQAKMPRLRADKIMRFTLCTELQ